MEVMRDAVDARQVNFMMRLFCLTISFAQTLTRWHKIFLRKSVP